MKPLNVEERLRLFRYGLIVIVIITFLLSLLTPYISLNFLSTVGVNVGLFDFLGTAVLFTAVVAVLAVVAYFAYREVLKRTVGGGS
jgi:multisubunit Na+/H+ antiporter MnhB subunit